MPSLGTCFRFYTQMRVEKKKAFAYRIHSHFTQQCESNQQEKIKPRRASLMLKTKSYIGISMSGNPTEK